MYSPHHIALSVRNRDRSAAFYQQLGFREVDYYAALDGNLSITHLLNKGMVIELFCYAQPTPAPATIHATATDLPIIGTKHFALVAESIDAAKADLVAKGLLPADTVIQTGRTVNRYFFVKDPDGILVEIVEDHRVFKQES